MEAKYSCHLLTVWNNLMLCDIYFQCLSGRNYAYTNRIEGLLFFTNIWPLPVYIGL